MAALGFAIAVGTAAVSAAGVFARGDGSTAEVISVRGERYELALTGIYAFNPQRLVAEGVGWDLFTLVVAVPALLASLPSLARDTFRGRLFALGLCAYLFYQYFMYALTWAVGPLLVPFVLLSLASGGALVLLSTSIVREGVSDPAGLRARFTERFPRQGMALLSAAMALALTAMWAQRIGRAVSGDLEGAMLLGQTTLVVQVLDLVIVVPLSIATAVALWRRRLAGYVLASVLAVKAVAMAGAICAMLAGVWMLQGRVELGPLLLFGGATIGFVALGFRMYAATLNEPSASARRDFASPRARP